MTIRFRLEPIVYQYLQTFLPADFLCFYKAQVRRRALTYDEATNIVLKHFNSTHIQRCVKAEISTLFMSKFLA